MFLYGWAIEIRNKWDRKSILWWKCNPPASSSRNYKWARTKTGKSPIIFEYLKLWERSRAVDFFVFYWKHRLITISARAERRVPTFSWEKRRRVCLFFFWFLHSMAMMPMWWASIFLRKANKIKRVLSVLASYRSKDTILISLIKLFLDTSRNATTDQNEFLRWWCWATGAWASYSVPTAPPECWYVRK